MPPMAGADSPSRILIIRPSALGDVARTVPAVVSCRAMWPEAKIDWLVNDTFVDAIAHHPDLNEVIPFPRKQFKRFGLSPKTTRDVLRYLRDLRRREYDLVLDLQGLSRSGWLTRSTSATRRVGPSDARELGWLGYTDRIRVAPSMQHTVDRMLAVVQGAGIQPILNLQLHTSQPDRNWASQQIGAGANDRLVVVAPGAMWASKRWPADRFVELVRRLTSEKFTHMAIVGTESERAVSGALLNAPVDCKRVDLLGQTTVGQLMAVIEQADLVLANDSAALHLAIGLGRRCVGLFGPTDPEAVGPYRYPVGVARAEGAVAGRYRATKDDPKWIKAVSIEDAWEVTQRVLDSDPPQINFA